MRSGDLSIGDFDVDWRHPGHFTVKKVRFSIGHRESMQYSGETDLSVHLSLRAAWKERLHVYRLDLANFVFRIYNGDQHSPPSDVKKRPVAIEYVSLKNGKFEYHRNHEGTYAVLHVDNINGRVRNIRSNPKATADAEITARYEKTGSAKLIVSVQPFAEEPNPNVRLLVNDQDLHDLTQFFDPNAGVLLFGHIQDADAHVVVNGNTLRATNFIQYEDLKVRLVSQKDRSKFVAYFMTLGSQLTMFSRNSNLKREQQTNIADLTRENDETLISFILRGLKEASMNVASRKPKK